MKCVVRINLIYLVVEDDANLIFYERVVAFAIGKMFVKSTMKEKNLRKRNESSRVD